MCGLTHPQVNGRARESGEPCSPTPSPKLRVHLLRSLAGGAEGIYDHALPISLSANVRCRGCSSSARCQLGICSTSVCRVITSSTRDLNVRLFYGALVLPSFVVPSRGSVWIDARPVVWQFCDRLNCTLAPSGYLLTCRLWDRFQPMMLETVKADTFLTSFLPNCI